MRKALRWLLVSVLASPGTIASQEARPAPVSPGGVDVVTTVGSQTPAFSWTEVEAAVGYQLVVFELDASGSEPISSQPLWTMELPRTLSWSPALQDGLLPGRSYAWMVRARTTEGLSGWSDVRRFEIPAAPSAAEVEAALEVLRRAAAAEADSKGSARHQATRSDGGSPGPDSKRRSASIGVSLAAVATPDRVGVTAAGGATGVTFGVQGSSGSTSDGSAGVVGESTAATGDTAGVVGQVASAAGAAAVFDNVAGGDLLRALHNGVERLRVNGAGDVVAMGAVSGASFTGDGSGLTSLDPANLGAGTAAIDVSGNAATATALAADGADCPAGQLPIGVDAAGAAQGCAPPPLPFLSCPAGQVMFGFDHSGAPACTTFGPQPIAPASQTTTTVDGIGGIFEGSSTSITLGADGLPVMSYYDATDGENLGQLKVIRCNDPACTGGDETISTVDSTAGAGKFSSITLGADGLPVVSYVRSIDLWVAKCNDPACSGEDESLSVVDSSNNVQETSIALGADGLPVISYARNFDLRVAKCSNPACSARTLSNVDTAGIAGRYSAIAIGADGFPVISYHDGTGGSLNVAKCNDAACSGGGETLTVVDSTNTAGTFTAIALGSDGLPIIAHRRAGGTPRLRVVKCTNDTCSTKTQADLGPGGHSPSIAVGSDGFPVISFLRGGDDSVRVAKCNNLSCSDKTVSIVDTSAIAVGGNRSSIVIGADGLPVISYFDGGNTDLEVAKCDDPACVP